MLWQIVQLGHLAYKLNIIALLIIFPWLCFPSIISPYVAVIISLTFRIFSIGIQFQSGQVYFPWFFIVTWKLCVYKVLILGSIEAVILQLINMVILQSFRWQCWWIGQGNKGRWSGCFAGRRACKISIFKIPSFIHQSEYDQVLFY